MIIANNLYLQLGSKKILDNVSFIFAKNQKIGVVGCNGAGKSTLLNVIGGHIPLDKGSLVIERGRKIAHLPQEVVLHSSKNVLQEAVAALGDLDGLQSRLNQVGEAIGATFFAVQAQAEDQKPASSNSSQSQNQSQNQSQSQSSASVHHASA